MFICFHPSLCMYTPYSLKIDAFIIRISAFNWSCHIIFYTFFTANSFDPNYLRKMYQFAVKINSSDFYNNFLTSISIHLFPYFNFFTYLQIFNFISQYLSNFFTILRRKICSIIDSNLILWNDISYSLKQSKAVPTFRKIPPSPTEKISVYILHLLLHSNILRDHSRLNKHIPVWL